MLTISEFKARYQLSDETFRRARKAAEDKLGAPVTERKGSKVWMITNESAILAELSLEARQRGFEAALEAELVEQPTSPITSALVLSNKTQTLQLSQSGTVQITQIETDLSHAELQAQQTRNDFNNTLSLVCKQIETNISNQVQSAVLSGIQNGLSNGMNNLAGKLQ